jgi:uncharacterized Zn-binding protein involved in type VI secretion
VAGTVALVLLLTASFGVAVAEAAFSPAGAGQIQGTWTSAVNSYDTLPYDGLGLAGGCQIKVEPEGTHGVLRGSAEQVIEGPDGPMTRKGVDRFDVDWTYSDPHAVTSGPARQVSDVEGTIRWTATWALSKDGESHSKVNEELTATFKGTWYLDGDKAGTLEGKATGQGVMTQTFPEANVKPEVTPKTVNWTFVSGGPGAAPSGAGDPASAASGSQTEKPGAGGLSITQVLIGLAAAGLAILGIGVGLKRRPAAAGAASDSSETAPLPDALPTQLPAGGSESEAAGPGGVDEAPEEEPEEPVEPEEPEQTEDERKGERVVLELLYPVGHSPKVFTNGWVFDARCVLIDETGDEADFSECVEWSGSGEFEPAVGSRSRPSFASEGQNTIVLKCDVGDQSVSRTFAVDAVSPAGFASVGTQSHCPEDAHGCVGCPHTVIGPVTEGSPLVRVNGKPAARVGDNGVHAACCGPNTFVIEEGDPEVLIDGRPAARVGDSTRHCGGFGHLVSESRA